MSGFGGFRGCNKFTGNCHSRWMRQHGTEREQTHTRHHSNTRVGHAKNIEICESFAMLMYSYFFFLQPPPPLLLRLSSCACTSCCVGLNLFAQEEAKNSDPEPLISF